MVKFPSHIQHTEFTHLQNTYILRRTQTHAVRSSNICAELAIDNSDWIGEKSKMCRVLMPTQLPSANQPDQMENVKIIE